ncbi:MAG TPA: PfkB family carbohydrate kinase [Pseudolabrys sp.]|nr:PfkB family carbohydrate kinase [Pseudolabrys sp.]
MPASAERAAGAPVDVVCAGGAVQDFIMRMDRFPEPGTKKQASDFVSTIGGQSGNTALAVARLGGRAHYAGPVGDADDDIANRAIAMLEREGVDCSGAIRVPGGICSASLIMIDGAGEKLISTRRGHGLRGIAPPDPARTVAAADAVLLDNRYPDFIIPIAQAAAARGIPRVLDIDYGDADGDQTLPFCDYVVASAEALRAITGVRDLAGALLTLGQDHPGFLAVTDGPDGVYWRDGAAVRHMPAFKVDAIDTLGAGDIFHAGFTLRLVETGDPIEAMRFGSAAAALKCTQFGGAAGTPRRAEVNRFLQAQDR